MNSGSLQLGSRATEQPGTGAGRLHHQAIKRISHRPSVGGRDNSSLAAIARPSHRSKRERTETGAVVSMPARFVKLTVVHRNVTRRSRHRAAAGSRSSAAPHRAAGTDPVATRSSRAVAVTAVGHGGERHGIEAVAARRAIAHSVHMTWPEALTARRALDQLGQRSMRTGQRLSQPHGQHDHAGVRRGPRPARPRPVAQLDRDRASRAWPSSGHESARAQRLQHSPEGEGTSLWR
jgi:hypothetical protein